MSKDSNFEGNRGADNLASWNQQVGDLQGGDRDAASELAEYEPTEQEREDRRHKANRATRGALAALLCLEAFVVLLIPRAIAQTATGLSGTKTVVLLALAVVLVGAGFLLRRPWGIGLGTALQLVFAATVVLVPWLIVVVVMFGGLWLYVLRARHQLAGTPSGWRMLIS